jgi:hypothetical protein
MIGQLFLEGGLNSDQKLKLTQGGGDVVLLISRLIQDWHNEEVQRLI